VNFAAHPARGVFMRQKPYEGDVGRQVGERAADRGTRCVASGKYETGDQPSSGCRRLNKRVNETKRTCPAGEVSEMERETRSDTAK
jgi:hypothetical protein